MNLQYDLCVADEPSVEDAEPWASLVDARELEPRFQALPSRLQDEALYAHDRFLAGFAGRPAFHPARVDAEVLERWLWHEARDPAELTALRRALNALLMKAFDLGFRNKPLVVSAYPFGAPTSTIPAFGRSLN